MPQNAHFSSESRDNKVSTIPTLPPSHSSTPHHSPMPPSHSKPHNPLLNVTLPGTIITTPSNAHNLHCHTFTQFLVTLPTLLVVSLCFFTLSSQKQSLKRCIYDFSKKAIVINTRHVHVRIGLHPIQCALYACGEHVMRGANLLS